MDTSRFSSSRAAGRARGRFSRGRIGALAAVGCTVLALGAAASVEAGRGPSVRQQVQAGVNAHNSSLKALDLWAQGFKLQLHACKVIEASGDPAAWRAIEIQGQGDLMQADHMKDYNKALAATISVVDNARVKLNRKQRKQFNHGLALLKSAHKGHGREFYDLTGVGTNFQAHSCDKANTSYKNAAADGEQPWADDFHGFKQLVSALGMKSTVLGYNPYLTPGS